MKIGFARGFLSIRKGHMPPWFHARTSPAAWVSTASLRQRKLGMVVAMIHATKAKAAGQHNVAATWLDLAAALWASLANLGTNT